MSKLLAATCLLALSSIALAAPDFSGTYTLDASVPVNNGRQRSTGIIEIAQKGQAITISEKASTGPLIEGYACTADGACELTYARGQTKMPGKVRFEGNDVLILDADGLKTLRRYSLSADKKSLTITEIGGRPTKVPFNRG